MEHFQNQLTFKKEFIKVDVFQVFIFLVIPEILTISLRKNENIEGIDMGFYKQLLNQFADDMDIASMA